MGNSSLREALILKAPSEAPASAVVYVLDGYFGNGRSMLSDPGPLGRSFAEELVTYQAEGLLPPCHFVFVDGSTRLGGSQYINSAACGAFSDHITQELIPMVEAALGIEDLPRVVMGHSSGGYGAFRLPMEHPHLFAASLVSAADCFFEHSLRNFFMTAAIRLNQAGGIDPFLDEVLARTYPESCPQSDFLTLMIIAMASCYSPELGANSAHARLPFDPATLEMDSATWSQWLENDPLHFADDRLHSLSHLGLLILDCGIADEYGAQFGHRRLSARLKTLGVSHIHQEFQGGHSKTRFRYRQRLEILGQWLRSKSQFL